MKLLFFISSLAGGGAERVLANIANELINRNYDITIALNKKIIVYNIDERIKVIYSKESGKKTQGNIVSKNIKYVKNYIHYFFFTKNAIQREKPNIIITLNRCNFLPIILFHKNTPIVSSEHNTFDWYQDLRKYINRFYLSRFFDAVTVLTPFDKGYANAKGLKKVVVIPNPNTLSTITKETYDKLFNDRKNLLACGRLDAWDIKGFDLLIKSFAIVSQTYKDIYLDIAGTGTDKNINYLKNLARECNVENKINFIGFISNVAELQQKYKLFLNTSRTEGFSMTITEAMTQGNVCVSFDVSGPSSIVLNRIDGVLVERENIQKLADSITYLLSNTEKCYSMGIKAIENVERFSVENVIVIWEKLFKNFAITQTDQ